MRILKNIVWNFAARHRLVYDAKIHGLPFVPDTKKASPPPIVKTAGQQVTPRTNFDLPTIEVQEADGTTATRILKGKEAKGVIEGRESKLTDYDRTYLLEVFKYKSMAKVIENESIFAAIKTRWAINRSITEIETASVGMKARSITKCFKAFQLAMERKKSDRGEGIKTRNN